MSVRTAIGPGYANGPTCCLDWDGEVVEFRVGRRRYWMSEWGVMGGRMPQWWTDQYEMEQRDVPMLVWAAQAAWDSGGRRVREQGDKPPRAIYSLREAKQIASDWEWAERNGGEAGGEP